MQINLQSPARSQQDENPDVIRPQAATDGFPFADRKVRRQQILRQAFGPLVAALAQALVYGLGGYLAVTGAIAPGTVVTLAMAVLSPFLMSIADRETM